MLVLDLGCGANKYPGATGVDIQRKYFHHITVPDIIASAFNTPFPDCVASMVVMRDFIEHIDCVELLREVRRILKPKGKVLIDTPNSMCFFRVIRALRSQELNPHPDHIHVFSNAALRNLLLLNGFSEVKISYINKIKGRNLDKVKNIVMLLVKRMFPHLSFNLQVTAVKID